MRTTSSKRRTATLLGAAVVSFALIAGACSSDAKPAAVKATTTDAATPAAGSDTTVAGAAETDPPTTPDTTVGDTTAPTPDDTTPVPTAPDEGTPTPGGDLVMAVEADTSSPWRPAEMVCAISCHQIARTVYDPLMLPGSDEQPHPYLASAMEPNADFTVWRITARDGVKFHDGTPFDGASIVDNINRGRKSLLVGTALKSMTDVSVDPADPMVAVITVDKPWAALPFTLMGQAGYMASPTWLAASDTDDTLKAKPVGTGPFTFVDYKPGEFFKATKNADYWNKPYPYLNSIEFHPIADGLTRRDALKTGSVQMLHTTNGEVITEFRDTAELFPSTEITFKGETSYTMFHVTQDGSPLQDKRIRCALAFASDWPTVNETVNAGVFQLANGPFSPTQTGYLADNGFPLEQDMAKAQELVADYKAENPGALTLALATTNDETNLVLANFQKQWYEEAGIDTVTIDQIDQGQFIVTALLGNFQVFGWRNHGGLDLDQQYFWWHSSSSLPVGELALNFGRIKDPKLDALLDANRASADPAEKKQIAEDVNKLFATECYNSWSWWTVWMVAHTPNVHGIDGENLVLPDDAGNAISGSGIAGTFYPQTIWMDS